MRSLTRQLLVIAAALGLWAGPAAAHHILGVVKCTDTSPGTPLSGVAVTITSSTDTYEVTTDADGYYLVYLPTVTDIYTVTIATPPGLTITSPAGGQWVLPIFNFGIGGPDFYDDANFALTGCGTPLPGKIGDTVY